MINIRPVSDLRNKYPEIEKLVLENDETIYLTKNGYGTMVVMSLEKYDKLNNLEKLIEERFGDVNMERFLEKMDEEINNPNAEYLTHEEVFSTIRRNLNAK